MKSTSLRAILVLVAIFSFSPLALADTDSARQQIAGILVNLNHFPSDADKAALMAIANDESIGQGVRMLANAVHNIQHAATAEDKTAMANLMESERAPASTKAIAAIVANINHMPSDEAKATLQAML